jgi:excisionase family DNA binding protein
LTATDEPLLTTEEVAAVLRVHPKHVYRLLARGLPAREEVAAVLRVHPKHVYRLLARGLPARRAGGKWLFSRADVLAWAARGRAPAPALPAETTTDAPPPLVAANGDVPIEVLLALVSGPGKPLVGFVQADREGALDLVLRGRVLAGAWHGEPPEIAGSSRLVWIHLAEREVGLATRPRRRLRSLASIEGLGLASRPATAGVRACLDAALARAGLDAVRIHEAATIYPSHLDVVCAVASGRADVGITSRAWAERLGLRFFRLGREPYGLFVLAESLGDPRVTALCQAVQSAEYRHELRGFAGYDPSAAGEIRFDLEPRPARRRRKTAATRAHRKR